VADIRHADQNKPLAEKIEMLLDDLLPQFGFVRVPRGQRFDFASSSEDSVEEEEWKTSEIGLKGILDRRI
jgi:hypothetical protein